MTAPRNDETAANGANRLGVIDTIGLAFAMLHRRPYLIWLPIALDSLVWSGLRVQVLVPVESGPSWLSSILELYGDGAGSIELVRFMTMVTPTFSDWADDDRIPSPFVVDPLVVSGGAAALLAFATALVALLIGLAYLVVVGRLVRGRPAWGFEPVRVWIGSIHRSIGIGAAAVAMGAFLLFPVAVIGGAFWLLGLEPWALVALAGVFIGGWLVLCFLFSIPAVALGEQSVTGALRSSYQLVTNNFLSVAGLLLIIFVIRAGAPFALQTFTESEWSAPFAIVVNAYLATGLVAAVMLFYQIRTSEHSDVAVTSGN